MGVLTIGSIKSMRAPTALDVTPDDRQEIVKCINGVFVNDAGYFSQGDVSSTSAIFDDLSWSVLKGYWQKRTRVDVIDEYGLLMPAMRVVVKKYGRIEKHKFWKIDFELWKI